MGFKNLQDAPAGDDSTNATTKDAHAGRRARHIGYFRRRISAFSDPGFFLEPPDQQVRLVRVPRGGTWTGAADRI